ncbi:hypothetical protein NL676_004679 [Syzygium grande]|nr:hypothetical protein NL676_004679 [Syzygium grande]
MASQASIFARTRTFLHALSNPPPHSVQSITTSAFLSQQPQLFELKWPPWPSFEHERRRPWPSFELEWPPWSATMTKLPKVQAAVGSDGRAPEELQPEREGDE